MLRIALTIKDSPRGRTYCLNLTGELDVDSAPELHHRILRYAGIAHLGGESSVALDLTRVTFIDSAGLRIIALASDMLGARFRVLGPPPPVAVTFDRAGLSYLLT